MAEQYKRRFGDRRDGRRVRSLTPIAQIMPYIMVERNDALNNYADTVEVSEIERWLREKRAEGYKGMGMLHLFVAAYVRTIANRPALNRFIAGQKVYHRNTIDVCMSVKRTMSSDGADTTIKVTFEPEDTIYDVYRKFNEKIDEIKANDGDNNTEAAAGLLMKIPGVVLKFAVWLLKLMDYFDLLPKALLDASPFHGSMFITDLGSLGIQPIYHHLYNFGIQSVFIAFGAKRRAYELDKTGQPVERKYVDFKLVMDERIADGYYYATALKYIKYFLKNPQVLETPPETVEQDIL